MAELFGKDRTAIIEHIQNVVNEGEFNENSACRNFQHTAANGKNYDTKYYNLDVIILVGCRGKRYPPQTTVYELCTMFFLIFFEDRWINRLFRNGIAGTNATACTIIVKSAFFS